MATVELVQALTDLELSPPLQPSGVDDTAAIQAAIDALGFAGGLVNFGSGEFVITDTLDVGNVETGAVQLVGVSSAAVVVGDIPGTVFRFNNAVSLKPLLKLGPASTGTWVRNITFIDNDSDAGVSSASLTSTFCLISAFPQVMPDAVNWKNRFDNCAWVGFKVGVDFSTDGDISSGADQNWCSETAFYSCKSFNCETDLLGNNSQSFNNNFYGCDFEKIYTGSSDSVVLHDRAGGQFRFWGGSMISAGLLYRFSRDAAGVSIWLDGGAWFDGIRVEARGQITGDIHYGALMEEAVGDTGAWSRSLDLVMRDCLILGFGEDLDLLRYAGRIRATFENITHNGYPLGWYADHSSTELTHLTIRQSPVNGFAATIREGSIGDVLVRRSPRVLFAKDAGSDYGAYDGGYATGHVLIESPGGTASATTAYVDGTDNDDALNSFIKLTDPPFEQMSWGLGTVQNKTVVFNQDIATYGITSQRFVLPAGARPKRFFWYKHLKDFGRDVVWTLHLVKDKADWAGALFDPATDTLAAVATIEDTLYSAGMQAAPIRLEVRLSGDKFQPGEGEWLEGKVYAERRGNLLSSDVENDWGQYEVTTSPGATDPLGTTRAYEVVENTATAPHRVGEGQFKGASSQTFTITCSVKQGVGDRNMAIVVSDQAGAKSAYVLFDLTLGAVNYTGEGGGDGWLAGAAAIIANDDDPTFWDVSFTFTTGTEEFMYPTLFLFDGGDITYTGDGSSLIIWNPVIIGVGGNVAGYIGVEYD